MASVASKTGLAHAGRASDQRVAHVADVRHQPERRRAIGAGDDQRRAVEVVVVLLARPIPPTPASCAPGSASRRWAGARWRRRCREWTTASASTAFRVSGMVTKPRPWMTRSTMRSFSSATAASASMHGDGGRRGSRRRLDRCPAPARRHRRRRPCCWRRYRPAGFPAGRSFRAAARRRSCAWRTTGGAGGRVPFPPRLCPGRESACSSGRQSPGG